MVRFIYQILSFRLGDSGLRLATMSVCFVVLISCSILWRPLSGFSTSMPMFRYLFSFVFCSLLLVSFF